jgi:hypothetical protein
MMAGKIPDATEEEMDAYENHWKGAVADAKRNEELGLYADRPRRDESSSR